MKFLALLLTVLLLAVGADARPRRHRAASKRSHARSVTVECPPPIIIIKPDVVIVIRQSDEEKMQARISRWMATQPALSEAAYQKLRETAETWFRKGRDSVSP